MLRNITITTPYGNDSENASLHLSSAGVHEIQQEGTPICARYFQAQKTRFPIFVQHLSISAIVYNTYSQ